jgi:6-phosphogluconolactonase
VTGGAPLSPRERRSVRTFYVGCYTAGAGGHASGIEVVRHDPATGEWTVGGTTDVGTGATGSDGPASPSYLAWHPDGRHLYAVGEVSDGRIWAFVIEEPGGRPAVLASASTGGEFPCHLSVDLHGEFVLSTNYGSGSISVHPIRPDGSLGPQSDLLQHKGSGPHPDRQLGPHAHMTTFACDTLVLAVDLGVDGIGSYRLDKATGRLASAPTAWSALPTGFGPRHVALLPDDLVAVVGELTGEIALMSLDPVSGGLTLRGRTAGTASGRFSQPSGIAATSDGRFVLMANRGTETVAAFELGHGASDDAPRLVLVDEVPCGGENPRDITLVDDAVYVANQDSGTITVLAIDTEAGFLTRSDSSLTIPSPTHLLAAVPRPITARTEPNQREEQQ